MPEPFIIPTLRAVTCKGILKIHLNSRAGDGQLLRCKDIAETTRIVGAFLLSSFCFIWYFSKICLLTNKDSKLTYHALSRLLCVWRLVNGV